MWTSTNFGLFWILCLVHSSVSESSREAVHDDPFVVYPFRLTSTSPFGRIEDSALPGSEVPVDSTLPHFEITDETQYLELELFYNVAYNASTAFNRNKQNYNFYSKLPVSSNTKLTSLPSGVRIDISGEEGNIAKVDETMAFTLDENLHIVVGNSQKFPSVDGIQFWVVAILQNNNKHDQVVSNPLSFVIKIEHDQSSKQGAAIYAGVVVLVVCLFALLIPLTVRTKRRLREGKPVCVCGSSSKKMEEGSSNAETETGSDTIDLGQRSPRPDPPSNAEMAVIFDRQPRKESQKGRRPQTIQSKNMRSATVTEDQFQPRWLDPHYHDVYERPVFTTQIAKALSSASLHVNMSSASLKSGLPSAKDVRL